LERIPPAYAREGAGARGRGTGGERGGRVKDKHAVMAVDPGETTGVFVATVELSGTMAETCKTITRRKAAEVKGDFREQGRLLHEIFLSWTLDCERFGVGAENRHVACEDFVLRRRQEGGATGNLTSIWVMAAFIGATGRVLLPDEQLTYQQPSSAMTYAKNERLKSWGLWEVGSEHKRDAARHWALRVNKLLG
jgi:hypothetical protein